MNTISGITEDDIADYLVNSPDFFERHAELLASVQLTSPHGHRAVSLQERQMEMLRGKIKALELRIVDMIRLGQDNQAIADHLHVWTRRLMCTVSVAELPHVIVEGLQSRFMISHAALRVWGVRDLQGHECARAVDANICHFASELRAPYCGMNAGLPAIDWLDDAASVQSVAMVALRHDPEYAAFGLLVLGSPSPHRFSTDMGTDFLVRIGELASASFSRWAPHHSAHPA